MAKDKMVFPGPGLDSSRSHERGLTKREYFAITLLTANGFDPGRVTQFPLIVNIAINLADELIKQLDEQ